MRQAATPTRAFGVDPVRRERYSLRQSRYDALAADISEWAGLAALNNGRLSVLDVGCGAGVLRRHLAAKPHFDRLSVSATNLAEGFIYLREAYDRVVIGDVGGGYPEIESDTYDVVVCEQVLEHLAEIDAALATLERVLRPGGKLVLGVPVFVPPLHLIRKHLLPKLGRILAFRKLGSHQQAFSLASFLRHLADRPNLEVMQVRGFRIISGGLLRPLENYRWWWNFNRKIGRLMPALCIEIQVILRKTAASAAAQPSAAAPRLLSTVDAS